ncbi:hypothetical protein STAS_17435 [Striga asiatica]|uniref:Uncharacterized protein n=1 Tax=Striga asiatica TaxID=4170 RepID=A0A5A7Q756_STRAF|nr:hypothetical protein STAS_17435 [Striga asiatica]
MRILPFIVKLLLFSYIAEGAVDGKSKTSKAAVDKGGVALKSRKALNDITNKSCINVEASSLKNSTQNIKPNTLEDRSLNHHVSGAENLSKKKISVSEKLNVAEEGFLHDHNKCIEAQKNGQDLNFWDTVLPGHDSADLIIQEEKIEAYDMCCHPELEELSMLDFSDWFEAHWKSPPSSPICSDSRPSFISWELEQFELTLKEENSM